MKCLAGLRQQLLRHGSQLLVVFAALLLLGWLTGLYPPATGAATKPLAALGFLLIGLALATQSVTLMRWLAGGAVLCSLLGLAQVYFALTGSYRPGIFTAGITLPAAVSILLAGLALLLHGQRLGEIYLSELGGLLVVPIGATIILGTLFGVPGVPGAFALAGAPLPTGLLALLSGLLLILHPPRSLSLRLWCDAGPAGLLLRGVVPLTLLVLPLIALLRLHGERAGWYGLSEGLAYMIGAAIFLLLCVGLYAAWRMARLDAARAADYRLLTGVLEASGDPIFVKDLAGRYQLANPAALAAMARSRDEVIGHSDAELFGAATADALSAVDQAVIAMGQTRVFEDVLGSGPAMRTFLSTKSPLLGNDGEVLGLVGVAHEITERKRREAEVAHQSLHDGLTGLANRSLFVDRLKQALLQAERKGHRVAVVDIDVDAFRVVNEEVSFAAGDALLQLVAQRISASVRSSDTVARIYGDEFLVLLAEAGDTGWVEAAVQRIESAINVPWQHAGREIDIAASAGISVYPDNGATADELIQHAESAMHRAKDLGKNRLEFSRSPPALVATQRLEGQRALRRAIENEEFVLHFQPKVALQSGQIVGAETLIRWQHPELGLVAPGDFIPLAEQCGLISPIGEWVMRQTCEVVRNWQAAGVVGVPVAVNLSAQQLHDAHMPQRFADLISEAGIAPHAIDFEVTETSLLRDRERAQTALNALREGGSHLALDDFGTGYSSLAFLRDFPVNVLKIDRSFVTDLHTDANSATIARTIIGMARSLKMRVVAEGVETAEQLRFLDRYRCDEMQGYLFSKPLPEAGFRQMLESGQVLDLAGHGVDRTRTLLLLDDEPEMLSSLRRLFRRDGYRLLMAGSGEEALALLAGNEVQVILSDQRLKGMSGIDFLTQVKNRYPDTIRIILSGYTELSAVVNSVNQGAIYKFLTKPWDDDELREQIGDAFLQHEAKFGRG